jgi:hypothetical protein
VNIKFCVKLGKMPTETYEMFQTLYGVEALSRSRGFERFKPFKDGREYLQDDTIGGRPSTSGHADTIANIREVMTRDRRLTLRMTWDEFNISKETIRQIRHEELWKRRRICASSSHAVSRMRRSNGDSHRAETSSRLVKIIPVFFIAL